MSEKYALIVANTLYSDPGLAQLTAPGKDAENFARVLKDQNLCAFDDVSVVLNQPEHIVRRAIEVYFDQRKPSDLVVLYFSGHGIRDELGALYLAVKNTVRTRLRSTAIKSDYVREILDQSRSKRKVLILDCCNSGAFPQGTKAATGVSIGTSSAFAGTGYGLVVLTASDSTQFAWEGDQVIGETENSLFTHFLVKGLEGEADQDGDGTITVDELYDYAYEQVVVRTPRQTPGKWSYKQQGEIVLLQRPRQDIKAVDLPVELIDEIEDTRPYVREAAVQKLEKILRGKNIGLMQSAIQALEKIAADENTTRRVAQNATRALEAFLNATPDTEKIPTEHIRPEAEDSITAEDETIQNDLEQQRGEGGATKQESQEPNVSPQVYLPPQTSEKKTSEQSSAKGLRAPKLLPMVIGLTLLFLCLGGGWAIWRYDYAPMSSEPTEIPSNKIAISEVPATITLIPTETATLISTPIETIAIQTQEAPNQREVVIDKGNIGTSVLGRSIEFTRLGNGSRIVVLAGALHGDEPNAAVLVDNLAQTFKDISQTVQNDFTFYFLPRLNPDGLENGSRYNVNGVDLNRNWDSINWRQDAEGPNGVIAGSGGRSPFSEPETRAFSNFLLDLSQESANHLIVLIYHSAYPPTGLIQPSYQYENLIQVTDTRASALAQIYAAQVGYLFSPKWTEYSITGEAIHWCGEHAMICMDIELPSHENLTLSQVESHMLAIMKAIHE